MSIIINPTIRNLLNSYDKKYQETMSYSQLSINDLKSSIELFNFSDNDQPTPKELSVIAIISGRAFSSSSIEAITKIQSQIASILSDTQVYFVKPLNLAVEYAVLKWPEEVLNPNLYPLTNDKSQINFFPSEYKLHSFGVQFHKDGCIILRSVEPNDCVRNFRSNLCEKFPSLPVKQSNWSHIPLGRILSPLNSKKFK
ncbi:hypothetical protein N8492_02610, partial [Synechococcus sp. AH-601-O06]|nr:hypothetical protein [Synechococcus sp. AH-601-O06]